MGLATVAVNGLSEGVAISSAPIDHSSGRTGLEHPPGPSTEATPSMPTATVAVCGVVVCSLAAFFGAPEKEAI